MPLLTRRMHLSGVWPGRVKSCPAVAVWRRQFGSGSLAAAVRQWQSGGRVGRKRRTGEPGGVVGSGRDVDPAARIGRGGIGRAVRIGPGRAARRDSLDEGRGTPGPNGRRLGRKSGAAGRASQAGLLDRAGTLTRRRGSRQDGRLGATAWMRGTASRIEWDVAGSGGRGTGKTGVAARQAGSNGRRSGYSTVAAAPTFSGSSSACVSAPGRAADSAGCALDWACCSCHRWGVSPFSLAKAR